MTACEDFELASFQFEDHRACYPRFIARSSRTRDSQSGVCGLGADFVSDRAGAAELAGVLGFGARGMGLDCGADYCDRRHGYPSRTECLDNGGAPGGIGRWTDKGDVR